MRWAASLVTALKEYGESMGVGGPLMKAAGFEELLPMDQISVIGIWEVIPKIPRLLKIKKAIIEEIEKQQPDAVITVDFPDFNFSIAKTLKKRGVFKGKIIHYVAPSVWAWRPGRAKKVAQFLDCMMCLFPMEVPHFTQHGLNAVHVGHPLVTVDIDGFSGDEFRDANSIARDAKTIGLFFGSRESEFKNMGAVIKDAALLVDDIEKGIHIIAPTLAKFEYGVQKALEGFGLPVYVTANPSMKWQSFKACDAAIAVSGTVALELAYAGVPHVTGYKINPITALILRFLLKIKHVHLANILLDKPVVSEFLQGKATPEKIAQAVIDLLEDESKRKDQTEAFQGIRGLLNNEENTDPSLKAAAFVVDVMKGT